MLRRSTVGFVVVLTLGAGSMGGTQRSHLTGRLSPQKRCQRAVVTVFQAIAISGRGDRFATDLDDGVTLALVRWVFPFEPDDFARTDVLIESDAGGKCTHEAETASVRRCVRWARAVVEEVAEGRSRCLVVVDFDSYVGAFTYGNGYGAADVTDDVRHQLARHEQYLGRVADLACDGVCHEIASRLEAGSLSRQGD